MERQQDKIADVFSRARLAFLQGDYEEVLRLCDSLEREFEGLVGADIFRSALNEKARALRNLGRIQEALDCYVRALQSAHESGSDHDVAWQLVLVGKLFGKYLQRQMLFSACLRESEHRYLDFLARANPTDHNEYSMLTRRYAVVQDLLGSYYRRLADRDKDLWDKSEKAYEEAVARHQSVGNFDGVSRATCHLAYARAQRAASDARIVEDERIERLRAALILFREGSSRLDRDLYAQRGRATRWTQEAHIMLLLQRPSSALRVLEDAISAAKVSRDPRALLLGLRMRALALKEIGKFGDAARELEVASQIADVNRLGFQRQILTELVEMYLALGEQSRAIEKLEEFETFVGKELAESSIGVESALSVFRMIAPERAEHYLREGQKQDYETLIADLSRNGHQLRQLLSRYGSTRILRLQSAIYQFARNSLRHSIKNDLQDLRMSLRRVDRIAGQSQTDITLLRQSIHLAEGAIDRISEALQPVRHIEGIPARVFFIQELQQCAARFVPQRKIVSEGKWDISFRDLLPEVLQEAFRHFLENAVEAIRVARPPSSRVPYIVIRQERYTNGGGSILLLNPGVNPQEVPRDFERASIVHGYQNAARFFESLFGFSCSFELREDGPRTKPYKTNCVRIRIPVRSSSSAWEWVHVE